MAKLNCLFFAIITMMIFKTAVSNGCNEVKGVVVSITRNEKQENCSKSSSSGTFMCSDISVDICFKENYLAFREPGFIIMCSATILGSFTVVLIFYLVVNHCHRIYTRAPVLPELGCKTTSYRRQNTSLSAEDNVPLPMVENIMNAQENDEENREENIRVQSLHDNDEDESNNQPDNTGNVESQVSGQQGTMCEEDHQTVMEEETEENYVEISEDGDDYEEIPSDHSINNKEDYLTPIIIDNEFSWEWNARNKTQISRTLPLMSPSHGTTNQANFGSFKSKQIQPNFVSTGQSMNIRAQSLSHLSQDTLLETLHELPSCPPYLPHRRPKLGRSVTNVSEKLSPRYNIEFRKEYSGYVMKFDEAVKLYENCPGSKKWENMSNRPPAPLPKPDKQMSLRRMHPQELLNVKRQSTASEDYEDCSSLPMFQ